MSHVLRSRVGGGGQSQPADVNETLHCSINFQMDPNNPKPRTTQSMGSQAHNNVA